MKNDLMHLNIRRRSKEYISFCLTDPPRSKETERNKTKSQHNIITATKSIPGMKKIRGDVALQVISYTSDKKIPSIAKYAKNLIDLMHKPEYLSCQQDESFLPFVDDRQIKYLYIKYIYSDGPSETRIKIRKFSSLIADLHHYFDNNRENLMHQDDSFDPSDFAVAKRRLDSAENPEQNSLNEYLYGEAKLKRQEYFGNLSSLSPFFISLCYPKKSKFSNLFPKQEYVKMLLDAPIRLAIDGIPQRGVNGESGKAEYIKKLKAKLIEHKATFEEIQDLKAPIIASIVYQPAANGADKDVDNVILEYILPSMNEVLNPPASHYGISEYHIGTNLHKIPLAKDKRGMCVGFEVLKMKKCNNNPAGGIYIGYRMEGHHPSLINSIDSYLGSKYNAMLPLDAKYRNA